MTREEAIQLGKHYFIKNPEQMVSLYKYLYGETICSYCPSKISEAWEIIKRNVDRPVCKYLIKPEHKRISNSEGHWTNFNLTDEVAERLITQGYSNYFICR
jgi:hypothetical protein